jgi:sugar phosphate isomerase/epimerase
MQLEIYRTLWGAKGSYAEAAKESRAAGFDGLETRVPEDVEQAQQLKAALEDHSLKLIAEVSTAGDYSQPDPAATVDDHIASLVKQLDISVALQPEFINCMGGCDAWDEAQNLEFFERCLEIERRCGITISHEIHRGRSLFTPWITRRIVAALPELKLTCDFSHWCVVCERLLDITGATWG